MAWSALAQLTVPTTVHTESAVLSITWGVNIPEAAFAASAVRNCTALGNTVIAFAVVGPADEEKITF